MSLYLSVPGSGGGGGSVNSVSNSDGTLTISPTTGNVVASLNLANPNVFTTIQAINLNSHALVSPVDSATIFQLEGADSTSVRIEGDSFAGAFIFAGRRADGTGASPSAVQANDVITALNARAYGTTGYSANAKANVDLIAAENWTDTHQGTYISLKTTKSGGTTLTEVARFENDGGITVPSTVTGGDQGVGTINAGGLYVAGTSVNNGSIITAGTVATARLSTAIQTDSFGITVDGGGSAITTGSKGFIQVPYTCTINNWTVLADQSGSCVVDIKRSTYSGFPTTSSIVGGGNAPTLSSAQKNTAAVSGWTSTAITAGDCIEFSVSSASTVTRINLIIIVTKS